MSAAAPIELLEDSDNDDNGNNKDNDNDNDNDIAQREALRLYLEFSGCSNQQAAWKTLRRHGFDVQQALAERYEHDPDHGNHNNNKEEEEENDDGDVRVIQSPQSATRVTAPAPAAEPVQTKQTEHLSKEWHRRMTESSIGLFVDTDFPPIQTSLDGRQHQQQQQHSHGTTTTTTTNNNKSNDNHHVDNQLYNRTTQPDVVCCLCGVPAAAKSVQSDGPNYGRFYLSCGQQKRFRARVTSTSDTTNSTETNKNGTTNKMTNVGKVKKCGFFQWDKDGSRGGYTASARYSHMTWQPFTATFCVLTATRTHRIHEHQKKQSSFSPSAVQQGAIGNCWFLSALAVVAERPYLIRRLLPHDQLNERGCYQINLCLDGQWTAIVVDCHLPVVTKRIIDPERNKQENENKNKKNIIKNRWQSNRQEKEQANNNKDDDDDDDKEKQKTLFQQRLSTKSTSHASSGLSTKTDDNDLMVQPPSSIYQPTFCAVPDGQLWPALIEKAYAKAHGSYATLSGGFIQEAFADLTGAPTETLIFRDNCWDVDELWTRLLSFQQAGFLMGVATSQGGDGLVGGHAYSVLDVVEVHDALVGQQQTLTTFVRTNNERLNSNARGIDGNQEPSLIQPTKRQRTTVRLLRIRNPWGQREWKGEWSADSEQWTRALRKKLGEANTYAKGDGTFFMSFTDALQRFHHMDVAKCHEVSGLVDAIAIHASEAIVASA